MAATSALLTSSSSSAQEHRQQPDYGSITDSQSFGIDSHSGGESNDASGAESRVDRRGSTARHSVLLVVPEEREDDDVDDNLSFISESSCSSFSCSSMESLSERQSNSHYHHSKAGNAHDADESTGSKELFWAYVVLIPVLLFFWGLFVGVLWFLPSSKYDSIVAWGPFGVGVLGWTVAFAFKTPIFAFFEKVLHLDERRCEWSTLFTAGGIEEGIRLGILSLLDIGTDFEAVYSLGLGWASIETVYYIGQSLFYTWWFSDDDYRPLKVSIAETTTASSTPAAATNTSSTNDTGNRSKGDYPEDGIVTTTEARRLLGIDRPWWSLMGRTSSMMVHIGLSCWLGYYGWILLIPAALVHGALYVVWGAIMPAHWTVPATSYGTMMAAMAVFLIGLALYGEIV
ncbi:hypothetical protein B0O80DRAFT_483671 [Mortierella sp. GBAus27b]|nr:hypothetical protein B0O80DRAFT_483671 [Mortierella sp. GBAus27b]